MKYFSPNCRVFKHVNLENHFQFVDYQVYNNDGYFIGFMTFGQIKIMFNHEKGINNQLKMKYFYKELSTLEIEELKAELL